VSNKHPAILGERLEDGSVRCHVCQVRCAIPEGKLGVCNARGVEGGELYTLIYGKASVVALDPVEKKPLFHFYPGRVFLTAGTRGCNFHCPGCQNHDVAHDRPSLDGSNLERFEPQESVALALENGAFGLAWSYNEPVIWIEHVLEAARAAKERGLRTALVTNGFATREALELLAPHLDAYRVDVKGFSTRAYEKVSGGITRWEEILDVAALAKARGLHVECVTNVTPGINDDESELRDLARWIKSALGPLTPWHVTRFFPHAELLDVKPTKVQRVERVREVGLEEGLRYVYVGNLPGHPAQDTRCHGCGAVLIARRAFAIVGGELVGGKCGRCGVEIPGRFEEGPLRLTDGKRWRLESAQTGSKITRSPSTRA
jgi:pyruvate formate lyase activating enzyme